MMNLKKVSLITLCIISLFGFSFAQNDVLDQKVERANVLLENLDAKTAQELLDEVLAQDSAYVSALYAYHKVELMYGNLSEAQALVRKAIEYSPSEQSYRDKFDELRDLINQVRDAQREFESGNYETAKRIYNTLIEKDPTIAELYYRLGFIYVQEEDYDSARDYFDNASIIAPTVEKYTKAKNILAGRILQEAQRDYSSGDLASAERKTLTSLRINPEYGSAYAILGLIKLRSGDLNTAIENFEKSVEFNPESASTWYNLGNVYRRTNQMSKAENALLRSIQLSPMNARAYTTLGQVFMSENKEQQAEDNFKMSITLEPNSPAARESYGELLNNLGRYEEAIEHLKVAASLISNPRNKYLTNYRLAYAYNRSGNHQKALEVAREVTTANARFGGGWFELGVAYAKLGNTQDAINAFNKGRLDNAWRSVIEPERERLITGRDLSF